MLFNTNTTALTKYRGATQKAEASVRRLEETLLVCFVCEQEGDGAPQSFKLFKCCGKHHVCLKHKQKDLVTRHEEARGGFTALKCACAGCRADALWPLVPLDKDVCDMNEQVFDTLVDVKEATKATKDYEKECDKEMAAASNRADARVAAANAARYKAEADLQQAQAAAAAAQAAAAAAQAAAAAAPAARPRGGGGGGYKRKADYPDGEWDAKQARAKQKKLEREEAKELADHHAKLAQILPPKCAALMGQAAYEEWLAEQLAVRAPAAGEAGPSSAGREECDEESDEEM